MDKWIKFEQALINNDTEALKKLGPMILPPVTLELRNGNYLNAGGYLTFNVLPETQNYIIHYYIDRLLDETIKEEPPPFKYKRLNPGQRFRKEKIIAFKVWELRTLRKPFSKIAKELRIKESAAKKSFYRAYEIIYERKYDPAQYTKPQIKKEYLIKQCSTCPDHPDRGGSCSDLCPDVIEFVEQDSKPYLREYLT